MRKEYDFSKATRWSAGRGRRSKYTAARKAADDELVDRPMTPAEIRKLKRRVADMHDPARYLLVSRMGLRFSLYYNVSDDTYIMNDPAGGTMFKRRKTAEAVRRMLGAQVTVVKCRTRKLKGTRVPVLASLGIEKRKKQR